jgi:hypothetical protein
MHDWLHENTKARQGGAFGVPHLENGFGTQIEVVYRVFYPVRREEPDMMRRVLVLGVPLALAGVWAVAQSQQPPRRPQPAQQQTPQTQRAQPRTPQSQPQRSDPTQRQETARPQDAIQDAQTPRDVERTRPEQRLTEHDRSDRFKAGQAPPSSPVLADQPDQGRMLGFDFARDPLGALKPGQTFEETMRADVAAKPDIMAKQKELLASRYNLEPRLDTAR